jgi:hypothetical protein
MVAMGSKSREVIYGGRIIGARIRTEGAQEAAQKDVREADRAAAELWSIQMEAYGGPAQPSPTIAQCLNAGYGWLQVKCHRCETEASIPLEHVRRPRDTPIWKLEAALKCRSCRTPRYSPRVHMIKRTQQREIAPYKWVHPDDDERRVERRVTLMLPPHQWSVPICRENPSSAPAQRCGPSTRSRRRDQTAARCEFHTNGVALRVAA